MSSGGVIPVADVKALSVAAFKVSSSDVNYESLHFCERFSLEERKAMAEKFKIAYPGKEGVVLHLAREPLKQLRAYLKEAQKPYVRIAVTQDVQMSEFVIFARQMFSRELPDVAGVFLYLCDGSIERIVSLQAKFSEYVERSRGKDGICHFVVTVEAVFGGVS